MGFLHPRARCPNCKQKISRKGGSTGNVCPHCGAWLTGASFGTWAQQVTLDDLPPGGASCFTCNVPIFRGDTACSNGHPLFMGWENTLATAYGMRPCTREEAKRLGLPTGEEAEGADPSSGVSREGAEHDGEGIVDALERLDTLRASGSLSDDEFEAAKSRILGNSEDP